MYEAPATEVLELVFEQAVLLGSGETRDAWDNDD